MFFIFMLTSHDRTVKHGLDLIELAVPLGVRHVGFKDVGIPWARLEQYSRRIQALGASSWLELVDLSPGAAERNARRALDMGVNAVLGGELGRTGALLKDQAVAYYPGAGQPLGHPSQLYGNADDVIRDCEEALAAGCAGVNLLAYRAVTAQPEVLIKAARKALGSEGELIVAGSVTSTAMIRQLARAGVDGFTVGTAITEYQFRPEDPSTEAQIRAVLEASTAPSS